MRVNLFQEERGITLIEVLSSIVILAIATVLVTGVLGQLFKGEAKTSKSISLKQDTNVLINQLRHAYNDTATDSLCFNHIGDGIQVDLGKSKVTNGNGRFSEKGQCIEQVDKDRPVHLTLVTESTGSDANEQVEINTIFDTSKPGNIDVTGPPQILDPKDIDWEKKSELPCNIEGDIEWTGKHVNSDCTNTPTVDGHLKLTKNNKVLNGEKLKVNGNLYTKEHTVLEGVTEVEVEGDAWLDTQMTFADTGDPTLTIHGNALLSGQSNYEGHSKLVIYKNVEFNDEVTFQDHTQLFVGRNALFKKQASFTSSNTNVFIQGHAKFNNQTTVDNNATLTIAKSADFTKAEAQLDGGKTCIQGAIKPSSIQTADEKSCDYTPPVHVE